MNQTDKKRERRAHRQTGNAAPADSLDLDPHEYREHLEGLHLTEAEENELLLALWSIMKAFVDLGFGVDSIHHFFPALGPNSTQASPEALESNDRKSARQSEEGSFDPARKMVGHDRD